MLEKYNAIRRASREISVGGVTIISSPTPATLAGMAFISTEEG